MAGDAGCREIACEPDRHTFCYFAILLTRDALRHSPRTWIFTAQELDDDVVAMHTLRGKHIHVSFFAEILFSWTLARRWKVNHMLYMGNMLDKKMHKPPIPIGETPEENRVTNYAGNTAASRDPSLLLTPQNSSTARVELPPGGAPLGPEPGNTTALATNPQANVAQLMEDYSDMVYMSDTLDCETDLCFMGDCVEGVKASGQVPLIVESTMV